MSSLLSHVETLRQTALDALYPPRCVGCDAPGGLFCDDCRAAIDPIPQPACPRCLAALRYGVECPVCPTYPNGLSGLRAVGLYTVATTIEGRRDRQNDPPLTHAIHRFKYHRQHSLAAVLGDLLCDEWRLADVAATVVAPVPSHPRRLAVRGYDHADLLARHVAGRLGLPVLGERLARVRNTIAQATNRLGEAERRANMAGAFVADALPLDSVVLLVDDVYTSGATMTQCAAALRGAGAKDVWGLVLARAPR